MVNVCEIKIQKEDFNFEAFFRLMNWMIALLQQGVATCLKKFIQREDFVIKKRVNNSKLKFMWLIKSKEIKTYLSQSLSLLINVIKVFYNNQNNSKTWQFWLWKE